MYDKDDCVCIACMKILELAIQVFVVNIGLGLRKKGLSTFREQMSTIMPDQTATTTTFMLLQMFYKKGNKIKLQGNIKTMQYVQDAKRDPHPIIQSLVTRNCNCK